MSLEGPEGGKSESSQAGINIQDGEVAERAESEGITLEMVMVHPESEPINGSITNEVVESPWGTVVKEFTEKPRMAFVQALGKIPAKKIEFQNLDQRIYNEFAFRGFVDEYEVEVPEILNSEDRYVEFEKFEGRDLNEYLNNVGYSEAYDVGEEVGQFFRQLHDDEAALTDARINNFLKLQNGDLGFVDGEYFSEEATEWEQEMDLITLMSSVRQVRHNSEIGFRKGFEEKYGESIKKYNDSITSLTSPGHASLLEKNPDRIRKSVHSVFTDLY